MKNNNSWVVIVISSVSVGLKRSRHVVEGETREQAIKTAEAYTGCRAEKAWPATGTYESLHLGRVSSGRAVIKA